MAVAAVLSMMKSVGSSSQLAALTEAIPRLTARPELSTWPPVASITAPFSRVTLLAPALPMVTEPFCAVMLPETSMLPSPESRITVPLCSDTWVASIWPLILIRWSMTLLAARAVIIT